MTTHRNARSIVFAALLASATALQTASATVYLNELRVHGDEAVELYNPGPEPVDVGGWSIVGTDGVYDIPEGASIAADGYLWLNGIGDIMSDLGGETSVIDLTINDVKDRVYYGLDGTAPLPPWSPGATIARAPDASIAPPPLPDPETDGNVWAIALNPTPGAMNVSRVPVLGTSLRILDVVLSASASSPTTILLENPVGHAPVYLGDGT